MVTAVQNLDAAAVKMLGEVAETAVREALAEYGVTVKRRGTTYQPLEATLKFKIAVTSPTGETQVERTFKELANLFDLREDDLGKTFQSGGKTFKVVGLLPNRPKRPVLCEDAARAGKQFVFTAEGVKRALATRAS